jgi:spermidine/putrescine-binding protein
MSMTHERPWTSGTLADAVIDRRLSRREFVGRGLKLGLGLPFMASVLAACGNDAGGEAAAGGAPSAGSGAGSGSKTIRLLGVGTSLQDPFHVKFAEDTGYEIEPVIDTLTGMLTKMLTEPQNYDAIDQNGTYLQPMLDAGVLTPIDVSAVPNWESARPLFTEPDAPGSSNGWPFSQIFTDDSQSQFKAVPTFYNYEAMGFNADAIDQDVTSYEALFDEQYAGQVAIWNDALWTIGLAGNYLVKTGDLAEPANGLGNLSTDEIDAVMAFLSERKAAGQFRAFWSDYGQIVNLMASSEVLISDGWNPAFEDAKRQSGLDLRYVNPAEGNRPWFHGLGLSARAQNPEAIATLADWRLDGWFGAQIAPLGYYSPTTTVEDEMSADDFDLWYNGNGRSSGSYDDRTSNVAFWPQWPDNYDYYLGQWSAFLAS